jgi:integral membrane protein
MFSTPLGRFRSVALLEGTSFLVLLGIAMPLKYFGGFPEAVKAVGMLHGVLFILFMLTLAHVAFVQRWSIIRILGAIIASLLPFGTFVLDARLKRAP